MKTFDWAKQGDDYEIYQVGGKWVMVVWGFARRGETGQQNIYGTDCIVATWEGEPCEVDDLPLLRDKDWMPLQGFDVAEDEGGGPDWEDYAAKVDEILAGL